MHLCIEKSLVVFDSECRRKLFNVSRGDSVKVLDAQGEFCTGCIDRVFSNAIVVRTENGIFRRIFLDKIEHIQKRGEEV